MAVVNKLIVNNLLCFTRNKLGKVATRPLKALLSEYYAIDDIVIAKKTLLAETDMLQVLDIPHISRKRRDGPNGATLDIDDIFTIFTYLDENNRSKDLPTFVSDNPDSMPSIKLSDGDLEFVLDKIKNWSDSICDMKEKFSGDRSILEQIQSSVATLESSIQHQCKLLSETVERLNATVNAATSTCHSVSRPFIYDKSTHRQDIVKYTVADERSKTWGSSACESADASASEMETGRGDKFEPVISKSAKKALKRKKHSPNGVSRKNQKINSTSSVSNSYEAMAASNLTSPNNAMITLNGTSHNKGAVRPVRGDKIIGSASPGGSLKAAPPNGTEAVKSVFCISNIDKDGSVDLIREHCKKLKIRVLFCFDITRENHNTKSFKLAVSAHDAKIISNHASWPRFIGVTPWIYKDSVASTELYTGDRLRLGEPSEENLTEMESGNLRETQNAITSAVVQSASEDINDVEPAVDNYAIGEIAAVESNVIVTTKCTTEQSQPVETNNGCTE